ncbi:hypothetical protein QBC46DRAFT_271222 [Diplogelasinospora grovesii]|uniref:N-acetyltransferase domain-containing protein n=1 Tax=Diplogelasinospora grovesii TaxID=303347 RepID=A0AAN6MZZ8_9PEZI|nr:hypothetical protein QBC46DRAFT_271222 [Diplogelasinospora grovesii]
MPPSSDQSGDIPVLVESEVVFAEATPEQRELALELNGEAWAPPLPLEVYMAREIHMAQMELASDGRGKYWVVYLKGDPQVVVASCETTRKTVLINNNGVFREGSAYAIASVHTNPAWRRRGMAAFMLRSLQQHMDREEGGIDGDGGVDCSVLYSDIGAVYYATLGWATFPSDQATLTLLEPEGDASDGQHYIFEHSMPGRTRYLALDEIQPLCELDEGALRNWIRAMPADGRAHVAFPPSFAQISWQLARASFVADRVLGEPLTRRGAITDDGRSWTYWDHDWRENRLKVLRIVTQITPDRQQRIEHIKVLLEAALVEAAVWKLPKVVVWNPDHWTTMGCRAVSDAHAEDIKLASEERRDSALPSFRWKTRMDEPLVDMRKTVWEHNFYYCWC